ncbi:MAG: 3-methyl-2-oxobutanoate dehydrogenase (2-methylpropanoyl-transferring) subunit alpha, partial [Altererythrobacter sp.]|nr:3-methyl-2-oxobutanoate dehydrogenase (2-methylpropanoyl-transferring) subunit alpha [Altererythrobacter sp.]
MADRPETSAAPKSNKPALQLHVPEPRYRPGDEVDYSHLEIPEAGTQPRPDETSDPKDMLDFAYGLVRVLGEDNKAHGAWDPKLDADTLRTMLRNMAM